MNNFHVHRKIDLSCKSQCYLFTCSLNASESNDVNFYSGNHASLYDVRLLCSGDKFTLTVVSYSSQLQCSFFLFLGSATLLYSKTVKSGTKQSSVFHYNLATLTSTDECFQKLKHLSNDTLFLVCQIFDSQDRYTAATSDDISTGRMKYLQTLGVALSNTSESFLKEKVLLKVGEESETISKGLLCARSPIFTKMFQSGMIEQKKNVVVITDIELNIIRALVLFLYTGKFDDNGFEFLCDLYYAADKYDLSELRQRCIDLLLPKISMETIFQALKFAFSYNIEWLKCTVMTLMFSNVETVVSKDEWRNLINDEPKIAIEVSNFFSSIKDSGM